MLSPYALDDIAHTIQLALAPTFLLSGIGAILSMLTGRLGRVVDRARRIEQEFTPGDHPRHDYQVRQLRLLDQRMKLANRAIFLCTASAVLVCIVVAGLFTSSLFGLGYGRSMATAFILAMSLLIAGLANFMWEIRIAVHTMQIHDELLERQ